ncbi:uncharacterized protein LOC111397437 [Olea europaea var. sylvestris]|uniref:uncharacterized protein LOC111397437 n=1 Tax=Olea europaea var. sylvestris TaxID=158386 RepID=UPI000C1D0142|nr:uncharacterized protein LOC111397437 [Olea europaea var. sylvestris]
MGGAGAMKAAAKVTRTLPMNGGDRQLKVENHPVSVAVVSARSRAAMDAPLMASSSQSKEELRVTAGEPLPKFIFIGLPTLQEAREATSELSHAGRLFLASSNSVRHEDMAVGDQHPDSLLRSNSHLPTGAIQAFQLLNESPRVQNAVSSIVADSNVWNAVIQNQDFQDLLQSRRSLATSILDQPSLGTVDTVDNDISFESITNFLRMMKGIVVDVMDWMIHWSVLFKNLTEADRMPQNDDGSTRFDYSNNLVKSIVGLVVSVIMMILMKRNK